MYNVQVSRKAINPKKNFVECKNIPEVLNLIAEKLLENPQSSFSFELSFAEEKEPLNEIQEDLF